MDNETEQRFYRAAENIKSKLDISNEDKSFLYGHYKQAIYGDNTSEKPAFYDFLGVHKWNAWNECRGIPNKLAAIKYISKVNKLMGISEGDIV